MTVDEIMTELKAMGSESIKKLLLKHGIKEPFFGVKIEHLKVIQKKVKKDYQLAKDLYATGNADAMYLAGLIADDDKMTQADLQAWVDMATSNNISEYTVPWVAVGGQHGFTLAQKWIDSSEEYIAAAGWSTLANLVSLKPDAQLDLDALKALLGRIEKTIHTEKNRVKQTMNMFVICAGSYVAPLNDAALTTAENMGIVMVDMGDTACKVPSAADYIAKAIARGSLTKKKKTVKC